MTQRACGLAFGFSTFIGVSLFTIAFAQEPPRTSSRPDLPWLNEENFKTIEPQLRELQKKIGTSDSSENREGKDKGPLSPEQRKAVKEQEDLMKSAESIARDQNFGVVAETDQSPLASEYRASLRAFQMATSDLVSTRNRHLLAYNPTPEQNSKLEEQWYEAIANCHKTKRAWIQKCAELYASSPESYRNLGQTLLEAFLYDFQHDRYDGWVDPLMLIVSTGESIVTNELIAIGISVCVANNRYTEVEKLFQLLRDRSVMDENKENFAKLIPVQMEKWNKELDRRKTDSDKNNNPIVEIRTSKGMMTIELFEDDAPEAVNSFIYLVERKYYDLKPFFRVEKGLVAQTGCEKGDGSGDAGYSIRGEADSPNKRHHFRGSLAVALGSDKQGKVQKDTGSSQFYIAKTDLPHLDDDYTVFGRVTQGIECLGLLRQMNLANKEDREAKKNPDLIISARVVRKRDHEYKPNPVTGRLFGATPSSQQP